MVGVRTLSEISDLVVEDESVKEVEDLKWYKRTLMNDAIVHLESFAPLKAKRYHFYFISTFCPF
jgi:hypothetical protein